MREPHPVFPGFDGDPYQHICDRVNADRGTDCTRNDVKSVVFGFVSMYDDRFVDAVRDVIEEMRP